MKAKGKKFSYQDFKRSELFGPGNVAYLENQYESYLDGSDVSQSLKGVYKPLAQTDDVKHRQLCNQLRARKQTRQRLDASAASIIHHYREYGHLKSDLKLFNDNRHFPSPPNVSGALSGDFSGGTHTRDAFEWIRELEGCYCQNIGFEIMHAPVNERDWLINAIEGSEYEPSAEEALDAYQDLSRAEHLEQYLGIQFVGQKRFSLEGSESLIPCLERIIADHVVPGYNDLVIGMAHRGRLNVLVNILGLSLGHLVDEFKGSQKMADTSGDVKYHLGHSVDRCIQGQNVHIALAFNPSHLEAINSVVMGNIRARIDRELSKPFGIVIHGDASIAGQGVVMETLNMSQVPAYSIGGVVHIVVNNQIGFTTLPKDARSSTYCTDIAKMIQAPVFHVQASDVLSVLRCAKLATAYRTKFQKDVVIDLVSCRKYGHNEADEPRATQPIMYQNMEELLGIRSSFQKSLIEKKYATEKELSDMDKTIQTKIKQLAELIPIETETKSSRHTAWQPYQHHDWRIEYNNPVTKPDLLMIGEKITSIPQGFELQKQVGNILAKRQEMVSGKTPLNWGMAELLAYQALINLGFFVRLVGQDCIRGTFAHRHLCVYDQKTGKEHPLLQSSDQANVYYYNSILSEYAALGYEYGYAETSPSGLVVWEAQFGDFVNGAQIVIDQFISSGSQKWKRYCGLVMLLPHGYEGQGPEHSSARLERFLQLAAQDNMQICIPSTPSQIYHLLMRQMLRPYRRPLIVFTPKSLLRHPAAISSMDDLATGQYELIIDDTKGDEPVGQVVICSGRVYYDLMAWRDEKHIASVAIVRLEQLYPFPLDEMQKILKKYAKASKVTWCQEEPENQGGWILLQSDLRNSLAKGQVLYGVTRPASAASSVGYPKKHQEQLEHLMRQVFEQ